MARKTGSHAGITGPRIRETARRLFARHGYAAVSMRQIAREVGVQAGALYTYTPDKQALLSELMRDFLSEGLARWAAIAPEAGPEAALEAFTRFFMDYNLDRSEEVFIAYMELRNLSPENFAEITALRGRYEDIVEQILRDGIALGVFRITDPRLTAFAILAMLTGVTAWYRPGGRLNREEVILAYWEVVQRCAASGQICEDPAIAT